MPIRYRALCLTILLLGEAAWVQAAPRAHAQQPGALGRLGALRALSLLRPFSIPAEPLAARAKLARPAGDPGTIAGTLSGLDLEGLASATVTAWSADSSGSRSSTGIAGVLPDGQYRIEGLEPGAYYVSATAKGYLPRYYEDAADLADAVTVTVNAGETVSGVDFALERIGSGTGTIAGVVRAGADGRGIADATVHAYSPDNPFLYGMAQTGKDGTYEMAGLYPGSYVLEVWANGFLPEFYPDAASPDQAVRIQVVEAGRVEPVDFALAVGGSISGYVRHPDGTPLAGAWIQASLLLSVDSVAVDGRGTAVRTDSWATTDETGFYRIGGLATGNWRVLAQASARWYYVLQWYAGTQNYEEATPVAVTFGSDTAGIDFRLALPVLGSAISGRVTDGEGRPVGEAFISLQNAAAAAGWSEVDRGDKDVTLPGTAWISAYASTDKDGNYLVGELPAGEYVVAAAAQAGWEYAQRWYRDGATLQEATPVLLGENQRAEGIDVVLPVHLGTASLTGVVRDSGGTPLAWAFVEVTPTPPAAADPTRSTGLFAYAQTDSLGAYRVDRLPAGDYRVHASYGTGDRYGQGWFQGASTPDAATPVTLADGDARTDVDFSLVVRPLYGTVAGTVTDAATGAPLPRAYIELAPVARDVLMAAPFRYSVSYAVTDQAGRYQLTWVPEGKYSLSVYANGGGIGQGGGDAAAAFEVVGGEVVSRDMALSLRHDGDGVITGTVKADYSGPMPMAAESIAPAVQPSGPPAGEVVSLDGRRPSYVGPVEVAVVLAYPVSSGVAAVEAPYTAVTAADGTYALRGLAPGEYAVMSFAPGCIGVYYGGSYAPDKAEIVRVDGAQPAEGIDFALAPVYYWRLAGADGVMETAAPGDKSESAAGSAPLKVYGRVTDAKGNAVPGATVYLLDESEQPAAFGQTSSDGSFELSGVVPGGYRAYASKLGLGGVYNGNSRTFVEAEPLALNGGQLEVNLVLSPDRSTAVEEEVEVLPRAFALRPCYPNPFNPSTVIGFSVSTSGPASLRVRNSLGQEVAVLFDGRAEAGRSYQLSFDAGALSAGVYFYTLEAGGQRLSRAMTLLK